MYTLFSLSFNLPSVTQARFIEILYHLKSKVYSPLNNPEFKFEKSPEAAAHNASLLHSFNWDIDKAINSTHPSQLSYGSEFKPSSDLEELLREHPHWTHLREILEKGATFPLQNMSPEDRKKDINFHLDRGNHKSSSKHKDSMDRIILEDVIRGFTLPLPIDIIFNIPNASLAPLGCVKQESINEKGIKVPKFRLTHDQSFPGPSGLSVNLRVKKDQLPNIMYSHVLLRTIHYICSIRQRHPTTRIYICKVDLDAAYRRCHLSGSTAQESLTVYDGLLFMALRMTFGGAPCPSLWGYISDTLADVCNTLIHNVHWDHNKLSDPLSDHLLPPLSLPEHEQFYPALPMAVDIPSNDLGKVDVYIDDTIGITPDIEDNNSRVSRAIPLAIHSLSRPLDSSDEIPRLDIISLKKYAAEGRMEETKVVLGWFLNTRSLTISLPLDKHKSWVSDLNTLISATKVKHKHLETTIGRLNHVAGIYHPMKHFLGRLYQAQYRASVSGWTKLSSNEKMDVHLMISFLNQASEGISLNLLTFRKPTTLYRSDASEFGIGGYNITSGNAWRFEIPVDCRLRTSLNSLEFLSCMITIWVDHLSRQIEEQSCLLCQTDSSTASGWLRKSNFAERSDVAVQLTTARHLAYIIIESKCCLYSQWFPGEENTVSDSLSRDFHIDPDHLSILLSHSFPEQVPFGLRILPLPEEIASWLTSLLRNQPQGEPWLKEPTPSKFALGLDTRNIYHPSGYKTTYFSTTSREVKNIDYSAPLPKQSERADFVINHLKLLKPNQSEPPWTVWHRPISWLTEQTQGSTSTENLHSFYRDSCADTLQPINQNPLK
jgi:hypothetical protein